MMKENYLCWRDFSIRSPEEMESAFKDVPEAIENTNK